jgi:phosphatidate cytidylyltransferase
MKNRITSGIIIGILFISSILYYRPLFHLIMFCVAGFMLLEWYKMTKISNLFSLIGLIIIPLSVNSVLFVSVIDSIGWVLLTYFCTIWCVDIMAMFGGKLIEGPKLVPKLSPKKTISGLIIGSISAGFVPILLGIIPSYSINYFFPYPSSILLIICSFTAILAQMSDIFISFFKRKFTIKDSGTIIPGHGGVLDRFDSIVLTAPILAVYLKVSICI